MQNYCRQPAARGIDSYFINFVFERASQRNILAARYTISNVGISLMAAGFALTSGQSIDITASRIFRGSYLMQLVDPKHGLKALVAQFGLAAVLLAILGFLSPALSDNRDRPIFWMWLEPLRSYGPSAWRASVQARMRS